MSDLTDEILIEKYTDAMMDESPAPNPYPFDPVHVKYALSFGRD